MEGYSKALQSKWGLYFGKPSLDLGSSLVPRGV